MKLKFDKGIKKRETIVFENLTKKLFFSVFSEKMEDGIDNEALDSSDSIEPDDSFSPDIIDEIEQQETEELETHDIRGKNNKI